MGKMNRRQQFYIGLFLAGVLLWTARHDLAYWVRGCDVQSPSDCHMAEVHE